jgi:3'(2'), 5'-bisphosphate nucleotidase
MMLNPSELQVLCDIAEAAAREVMAVYAGAIEVSSKQDESPLTQADLRADAVIRQGLEAAFPGVYIMSEESASAGALAHDTFFLVDPLDGTKEFVQRNGEFTVNIALVYKTEPVAGVVVAPALAEMFYSARGLGSWQKLATGPAPIHTAPRAPGSALRVIGSRSHGTAAFDEWLARVDGAYSFVPAGSSLKFCRLAQGQADVYPRLAPTCQWDTAAGQAVLQEAGGAVLDPAGTPLTYGPHRPVLNPHFIALADAHMQVPPII